MGKSLKQRISVALLLVAAVVAGFFVYPAALSQTTGWNLGWFEQQFKLGLDLQGGTHLIYQADVSGVPAGERDEALEGVRDVIERRVNAFGISEPVVQTSGSGDNHRVVVELAGVHDVTEAITLIGETPLLEFKIQADPQPLTEEQLAELEEYNTAARQKAEDLLSEALNSPIERFAELATENSEDPGSAAQGGDLGFVPRGVFVPEFDSVLFDELAVGEIYPEVVETAFGYHIIYKEAEQGEGDDYQVRGRHILIATQTEAAYQQTLQWANTDLGGKQLDGAQVVFDQTVGTPNVSLQFDSEGKELFADLTREHVGELIGIFLDGQVISSPRVTEAITGGEAVITGDFTLEEAKLLAQRLNAGALPVPIELISQQTVGATLGQQSVDRSLFAGLIGLLAVAIFMILYYRLPGVFAVVALAVYGIFVLTLFKLIGITLTLAGIAGFILSIGMAVDANILIFERMREELKKGQSVHQSVEEGFKRAWPSIRDGNVSTLITCLILFWFTTSLIKGFALTLSIGILTSMFTAITVTRGFMRVFLGRWAERLYFLFNRPKPVADSTE